MKYKKVIFTSLVVSPVLMSCAIIVNNVGAIYRVAPTSQERIGIIVE